MVALIAPWSRAMPFWAPRVLAAAEELGAPSTVLLLRAREGAREGEREASDADFAAWRAEIDALRATPLCAAVAPLRRWLLALAMQRRGELSAAHGALLWRLGNRAAAESVLRAALAASDAANGPSHPRSAAIADMLAPLLEDKRCARVAALREHGARRGGRGGA